jgi:DNA-binding response OmpR family regulator
MIKKKKILVIDNDSDILSTINTILKKNGFIVFASQYFEAAESYAKEIEFDLILIDLHMGPEFSGYGVLKKLRKIAKGTPKLVYITVIPKSEVILKGSDGFIQKPFTIESLIKDIKKLIKAKK